MAKAKSIGGGRGWKVAGTSYKGKDKDKVVTITLFKQNAKDPREFDSVMLSLDRRQTREFIAAVQDEADDIFGPEK